MEHLTVSEWIFCTVTVVSVNVFALVSLFLFCIFCVHAHTTHTQTHTQTHTPHTLPPFNLELIESKISSSFGCLRIVVHRNREKARSRSMFILVHAILFWVHPLLANEYHPNGSKASFSTGLKRAENTNTADGRWSIKLNSEINRKVK